MNVGDSIQLKGDFVSKPLEHIDIILGPGAVGTLTTISEGKYRVCFSVGKAISIAVWLDEQTFNETLLEKPSLLKKFFSIFK